MNETYSDEVETALSDGRKLKIQLVHVQSPQPWELNPEGTSEEFVILREGHRAPLVIRVSSRTPLRLERIDPAEPKGAAIRDWLLGRLEK